MLESRGKNTLVTISLIMFDGMSHQTWSDISQTTTVTKYTIRNYMT